ncbi:probable phospholipid-transporting ATPase IH [Lates japonicus]|uniref:Probable phospholipid-transporting ATPase IH n=1 Tax=Lates japonicus TaxID=270547 RepID=A0AAD3NGP2_LATJO|nr:probable phospholipid-transporting ATPase IH [Lates japonicus]
MGLKHGIHQGKSTSFYISSSPDEVALVEGMKRLGFTYLRLKDSHMEILNRGMRLERFELLEVLTFDSVRRRMSVIVRSSTEQVSFYLFCKGADSSIFPRVISGKVDQVRARVEHNAVAPGESCRHQLNRLHKAMKVWVLTGDKMETAAATCWCQQVFPKEYSEYLFPPRQAPGESADTIESPTRPA